MLSGYELAGTHVAGGTIRAEARERAALEREEMERQVLSALYLHCGVKDSDQKCALWFWDRVGWRVELCGVWC